MVRLLPLIALLAGLHAGTAAARTASARIATVRTAVATLEDVRVDLAWPQRATRGTLRLRARRLAAPDLGYAFTDLDWQCPLRRAGAGGWRCAGPVRAGRAAPFELDVAIAPASTRATLGRGGARIALDRSAATPTLSHVDLTAVPLAWTQALLSRAWANGRWTAGQGDARLTVEAPPARGPLRVHGPVTLRGAALDTPDGAIAAENLGARFDMDLRFGAVDQVRIDGALLGGQLLAGQAFIDLAARRVPVRVDALQDGDTWRVGFLWDDGALLQADGTARVASDGTVRALAVHARSDDLAPARDAYLSGPLGAAGFADAALSGRATLDLALDGGALRRADLVLADAAFRAPARGFVFEGLDGDVRFSSGAPAASRLRWRAGTLYGLPFDASELAMTSADGAIALQRDAGLRVLGGTARFSGVRVRPPSAGQGLQVEFGLELDGIDVAALAQRLGWPAFGGTLSGRIPGARYAEDRLTFDGGLSMQVFDGRVDVARLAMERPFGVAPTLSADVTLDDLDLATLTGALDFGGITGRLDGRIAALRLVDWQPVAFDAVLRTDAAAARRAGARQRISQRAVQDLSSVGDATFVSSLQGQLIGFFDDFGYARIGIACRLGEAVCEMDGLRSAGNTFTIVEGSGVPRLSVIGHNRRVDWPTLIERLAAVGKGDVKPVVE